MPDRTSAADAIFQGFVRPDGGVGTVILLEVPDLLTDPQPLPNRSATPGLRESLRERLDWWTAAIKGRDISIGVTPDALDKSGVLPISGEVRYAEGPGTSGLVFMDSTSYDPVSVTGQIASGATLIDITCAAALDGSFSITAMGEVIFHSLL